jgi:uncharacterized protein (DUF1501 family)
MKRRDLLKALPIGAAFAGIPFSVGGFSGRAFGKSPLLSGLLNAQSADGKVLVIINLAGGNDGLNTIIPYHDPLYISNRQKIGFTTPGETAMLDGFKLRDTGLAINPNMDTSATSGNAAMLKLFNAGKLAVVQNVGYSNPSLSHFRSTDIWNTSSDSSVILSTGWAGRFLETVDTNYPADVKPGDDPLAIQIGPALNPVFQGSRIGMGLSVVDPSTYSAAAAYNDDPVPQTNAGAELDYVRSILIQSDIYGSRFKSLFPSKPANKYPTGNPLAQQLQKVAWCISRGMTTKVYFVNMGGFDTHVQQNSKNATAGQGLLLNYLAEAISVFQKDLETLKIDDKVVGMTYSEFGRRVNDNDSFGTDHGTCAPQFLFGTPIAGEVYGDNPDLSNLDSNADLIWKHDFRQLYASVLADWFGLDKNVRKGILNDTSTNERFLFDFKVNGSGKSQSLFKNPARPSGVSASGAAVANFQLEQNYPNPFGPSSLGQATQIRFSLAQTSSVTLEVFDSRGALVASLLNTRLGRGAHETIFSGKGLNSGTYYYRLGVDNSVVTKTMTLIK